MGIPAYFSSIIKNYPEVIKKKDNDLKIKRFFLDCNSIIYDCFHKLLKDENNKISNYDDLIIKSVLQKLDYYYNVIGNNCNLLFLAFDGVAPFAKMDQQKIRRNRTLYEKQLFNKPDIWDTCAITPGTVFMKKLERALINHYKNNKSVLISFNEEGEGEHKIFDYIRKKKYLDGVNVIYGLDSDLIMLSLQNNNYCESIYLFREMPDFIKSIDSNLNPNEIYMIDINEFKKYINIYMCNFTNINKNCVYDYIFICFLLGNDFLPHFPSINLRRNGMDYLLDVYVKIFGNNENLIIDNNEIKWKQFRKFIIELSISEEEYIKDEYKYREKMSKRHFPRTTEEEEQQYILNLPIIEREKEIYINPNEQGWESRYYYMLFDINENEMGEQEYEDEKRKICVNYLQGLEWTFKYYSKGCIDWRWKYNYHYPPLLKDLKKYIPYFDGDLISEQKKKSLNNITQLYYVLPKKDSIYKKILHNNITNKFLNLNKYDAVYDELNFETSFCRYFWESHINFNNELTIDNIEKYLENV
jgi:5'-3' exonuclease